MDLDDLSFDRDPTDHHLHGAQPAFISSAGAAPVVVPVIASPRPAPAPAPQPAPLVPSPVVHPAHSMELAAIASRQQQATAPIPAPAPAASTAPEPAAAAPAPTAAVVDVKASEQKKAVIANAAFVPTNPHHAALAKEEWHFKTAEDTANFLQTHIDMKMPNSSRGLTSEEAAKRLVMYGFNQLTPPPTTPAWLRYLKQYTDPFVLLLLCASGLSFLAYGLDTAVELNLWLAIVLLVVSFISCTFSFIQEGKASDVMSTFKNMLAKRSKVIRDGRPMEIDSKELVPGDVVVLKGGDATPADLRMFYSADLKVDLSSLTGESVPISSMAGVVKAGTRVEESRNLSFNTSQCLEGEGMGVVIATGDNSLIGRIAALASDTGVGKSPLQIEIEHFVYRLTAIAVVTGVIFFIVGMARGRPFLDAFINNFVIIILAWVPQGLPMTVVSCLSLTARKLADRNVFVKELKSVETLGSCSVIASDKTGTLTQNKMSLVHLWYDLQATSEAQTLREPVAPAGPLHYNQPLSTICWLDVCAAMVNKTRFVDQKSLRDDEAQQLEAAHALSSLDPNLTLRSATSAFPLLGAIRNDMTLRSLKKKFEVPDDSKRGVTGGDASDTAIFNFVKKRVSPDLMRHRYEAVFQVPFSSRTKFALQIVRARPKVAAANSLSALAQSANKEQPKFGDPQNKRTLLTKGAPEVILAKCTHYMFRGARVPIDPNFRAQYQMAYETFGGQGERVLGFAMHELDEKTYGPDKDGTWSMEVEAEEKANAGAAPAASVGPVKTQVPLSGYTFLGLVSLVDPPKNGVLEAVGEVRTAGVKVIMVTGDHPLTAASIARQVGIITGLTKEEIIKLQATSKANAGNEDAMRLLNELQLNPDDAEAVVVTGPELEKFTEPDWNRTLTKKEIVFARTTPAQKLRIVEHLQAMNHVVAVTGDGVNDSPALKKADIGVAMGSGADVAKSAGDVIMMDDNFASIVVGIKEGRTIFDNLKKTACYTLTHLVPEIIPALFNLALAFPNGLSSILVLCIDCGTELAPAISFAYEKSEADVMTRPPRNAKEDRLVTRNMAIYVGIAGVLETLVCFIGFFYTFAHFEVGISDLFNTGYDYWLEDKVNDPTPIFTTPNGVQYTPRQQFEILQHAQSMYWALIVMCQFFHVWSLKARVLPIWEHGVLDNTTMLYGVCIELALMMIIIYVPFCQPFFGTSDINPPKLWAWMLLGMALMSLINEPRKVWIKAYPKGLVARYLAW